MTPRIAPRSRRLARRGFTLVELMVALAAGLAVAGAAYLLSKGSLDAFNQESRISTAQFAATSGMNQLIADLSRAGYQMSPHIVNDAAKQCGSAATLGSNTYAALQAVRVFKATDLDRPAGYPVPPANAFPDNAAFAAPDVLRIQGNFATTEQFEFRNIQGTLITLAMDRGATQRFIREIDMGGPTFTDIFPPNSWVRIVDGTGRELYMQLNNVGGGNCVAPYSSCTLTLANTPDESALCGPGSSRGLINPISVVDYWIGKVAGTANFGASGVKIQGATAADIAPYNRSGGDTNRTELIRTESDFTALANAALIPRRSQIVAEYAVGLSVGVTYRATVPPAPTLGTAPAGAAWPAGLGGVPPLAERYAGLTVQLTTRTRVPDREAPAANPTGRFAVCDGAGCAAPAPPQLRFARVRTLTREVNLPNLAGVTF